MEFHTDPLVGYDNTDAYDSLAIAMSLDTDSAVQSEFGPAADADVLPGFYDEPDTMVKMEMYASKLGLHPDDIMMSQHSDPLMSERVDANSQRLLAEVASARFRLDATLQHLVEKKDDSYVGSDGEGGVLQPDFGSAVSPMQSPRKAGKSRKRKRKDDSVDFMSGSQHQTCVMKLFDRSVDLAQFDEESPLYPICRAWIRNQPGNHAMHNRERTPTPEPPPQPSTSQDEEGMEVFLDVYHMPRPIKDEYSSLNSSCRIPVPQPQPMDMLNIHQDPDQAPPPEQLLLDHMVRWKQTRNAWREAGILNEMRYSGSMNLLREMFDRNMKEG